MYQSIAIHKHLCKGEGMDLRNLTVILRHGTTSTAYLAKSWQEDLQLQGHWEGKQHSCALAMLFSGHILSAWCEVGNH